MSRMRLAVACTVGLALTLAHAEAPSLPKPGPEHAKLGYFVGEWRSEGTMSPSPFGPGGRMVSRDRCEWFEGRFAVVCHYEGEGPTGAMKGLGILSYNPDAKLYTYYGLENTGQTMMSVPRGTLEGNTWTYIDETKMGDITLKTRFVITKVSQDAYTYQWEMQGEDGTWNTIAEGKSTRMRAQAKD